LQGKGLRAFQVWDTASHDQVQHARDGEGLRDEKRQIVGGHEKMLMVESCFQLFGVNF
jgi:hypothetical protein